MNEKPKPMDGTSPSINELPQKPQLGESVFPKQPQVSTDASIANRIGALSALLFVGSSVFAVGCMGWFAFLWWGTVENSVWRSIVINDWATRAVSLPSTLFRIAVTIQAGSCLSMLAALAIEKSIVPLPDIAAISMMRATPPSTTDTLLKLIYPLAFTTPGLRDLGTLSVIFLTALVLLTSSILAFTSTILLSDVIVQPIPSDLSQLKTSIDYPWMDPIDNIGALIPNFEGLPQNIDASAFQNFGYSPVQNNAYWRSDAPFTFAAFADSSSDAPVVSGLIDTGPTIRAFLPFFKSDDRSRLRFYKGKVAVWDARVVCQKPKIANFKLRVSSDFNSGGLADNSGAFSFSGHVQSSVKADIILNSQPENIPFFCNARPSGEITICQLPNSDIGEFGFGGPNIQPPRNYGGGLKSQFSEPDRQTRNGGAYLVLNTTIREDAQGELKKNPEWSQIGILPHPDEDVDTEYAIIGTLCYTPLDAVDRDVEISRIRQLEETEFAATELIEYMDGLTDTITPYQIYGNYSIILEDQDTESPESAGTSAYTMDGRNWQGDLFSAVMHHPQGNVALALQSLLTIIASNAFYSHLLQLTRRELVSVIKFQNVSSPGGPYGTRRGGEFVLEQQGLLSEYVKGRFPVGYTVVAVILAVQIIVAAAIFVRFTRETSLTRIGDSWQAVAQVVSGGFEGIDVILAVSKKVSSDRGTVAKELEALGADKTHVGVEEQGGSAKLTQRKGSRADTMEA
ncbi:hypothetical protein ABW20_dc0108432 [Dactylellina cionopaga]|nr:hypothetical protein ABW20_dc0108432 [Dactylellina cionopaga]